jgi:ribosome modulation factor
MSKTRQRKESAFHAGYQAGRSNQSKSMNRKNPNYSDYSRGYRKAILEQKEIASTPEIVGYEDT